MNNHVRKLLTKKKKKKKMENEGKLEITSSYTFRTVIITDNKRPCVI